jgi:cell division protein ZapA
MLLAAISLAHDLEEERRRRLQVEARSKEMLRNVLARIDAALEAGDDKADAANRDAESSAVPELHSDDFDL